MGVAVERFRDASRYSAAPISAAASSRAPTIRSPCPNGVLRLSITGKHALDKSARIPSADVDESVRLDDVIRASTYGFTLAVWGLGVRVPLASPGTTAVAMQIGPRRWRTGW